MTTSKILNVIRNSRFRAQENEKETEVWSRTSLQLLSSAPSIFRPTCSTASPSSVLLSFSFLSFRPACPSSSPSSVLIVPHLFLLPSYLSFISSSFCPTCPLSSFRPTFLYLSYFPLSNPPICACILHFVLLLVFHHSYSRFSVLLDLYIFLLPFFMFFILHHFRPTFTSSSCSPLLPFLPTSICWLLYCVINLLDV